MNMENIDMHAIACFGFTLPKNKSWFMLLHEVGSKGWKAVDLAEFEKNLDMNVKSSYQNLVSMSFKDLDTDFEYLCGFDNVLKLWKLEMPGSPADAVDKNDKKYFFKSAIFKRTCKRADEILSQAYLSCRDMLMPEVEHGKFIDLDEVKLAAVMNMLEDQLLMKNLKTGKYVH